MLHLLPWRRRGEHHEAYCDCGRDRGVGERHADPRAAPAAVLNDDGRVAGASVSPPDDQLDDGAFGQARSSREHCELFSVNGYGNRTSPTAGTSAGTGPGLLVERYSMAADEIRRALPPCLDNEIVLRFFRKTEIYPICGTKDKGVMMSRCSAQDSAVGSSCDHAPSIGIGRRVSDKTFARSARRAATGDLPRERCDALISAENAQRTIRDKKSVFGWCSFQSPHKKSETRFVSTLIKAVPMRLQTRWIDRECGVQAAQSRQFIKQCS